MEREPGVTLVWRRVWLGGRVMLPIHGRRGRGSWCLCLGDLSQQCYCGRSEEVGRATTVGRASSDAKRKIEEEEEEEDEKATRAIQS